MKDLLYKDECYKIVGACFEVYQDKGGGFHEPLYHECLEIEFALQCILFYPKKLLTLTYKGHPLKHGYEPDFICYEKIILEVKAVSALADEHRAQLLNYLAATGFQLGLLVNFDHFPKLEWGMPRPHVATGKSASARREFHHMNFSVFSPFSRLFACFAGKISFFWFP